MSAWTDRTKAAQGHGRCNIEVLEVMLEGICFLVGITGFCGEKMRVTDDHLSTDANRSANTKRERESPKLREREVFNV